MASIDGHDYLTIGGIKWATMNIGASSITSYGQYFQWGDTTGFASSNIGTGSYKKQFNWTDYMYRGGYAEQGSAGLTKYNVVDLKMKLDGSDDGAKANWGGSWRVPTRSEFLTLTANTNISWTTNYNSSGVAGALFTSKSDSSVKLFFPAAGLVNGNGSIPYIGQRVYYWLSDLLFSTTREPDDTLKAYDIYHPGSGGSINTSDASRRFRGMPIRAVNG